MKRILLLSNDSFIVGFLKGYCGATKYLILDQASNCNTLQKIDIENTCELIIVDLRKHSSSITSLDLNFLHRMNCDYNIPVCAIRDSVNDQLDQTFPWMGSFFDDPVTEQLDSYLRTHFAKNDDQYDGRRSSPDRRSCPDRRVQVNRRISEGGSGFGAPTSSSDQLLLPSVNHHNNNACEPKKTRPSFMLGPFEIDKTRRSVLFKGKNLELTGKEFKLFDLLAADIERIFSAEEIIQCLWPETDRANKSDLYQYMHLLRKKVEIDPDHPYWILTIKGVGYKLNMILMHSDAVEVA